jgi:hypothetical protein
MHKWHFLSKNFYIAPLSAIAKFLNRMHLLRGSIFLLITDITQPKIFDHEKYTLFDRGDINSGLDVGFLCIQCRWLNTYFDRPGRYIINTWPNAQHTVSYTS